MKEVFYSSPLWIKFAHMTCAGLYLVWLAAVLIVVPAYAQGQGVLEGSLVNGTDPARIPAGVEIDIIGLGGGMSVLKSSTTDAAGKFRVDGLPTNMPMLVRAGYKSVYYYGQASFDASGKARVDLEVFEPTDSWQGIRLDEVRIAFQLTGERLRSLESYTYNNGTKPPRSFMREDGNFRFPKADGIMEPPRIDVTAPGSSMPVTQAPLESADGRSYYSLYPLRPGTTTFDVSQELPYQNHSYTFRTRFDQDVNSINIGVIPADMTVSGEGLVKVKTDAAQNFTVYSTGPIKAGTEVAWTFSGGTPVAESPVAEPTEGASVQAIPTLVGRNAMLIGPLLFVGLITVLWYAHARGFVTSAQAKDSRIRELKERKEQMVDYIADLDQRYENQGLNRNEYLRLREQGKRHLRRITMLLSGK